MTTATLAHSPWSTVITSKNVVKVSSWWNNRSLNCEATRKTTFSVVIKWFWNLIEWIKLLISCQQYFSFYLIVLLFTDNIQLLFTQFTSNSNSHWGTNWKTNVKQLGQLFHLTQNESSYEYQIISESSKNSTFQLWTQLWFMRVVHPYNADVKSPVFQRDGTSDRYWVHKWSKGLTGRKRTRISKRADAIPEIYLFKSTQNSNRSSTVVAIWLRFLGTSPCSLYLRFVSVLA